LGNTLIWTVGTLTLQILFGVGMALVLHQNIWFRSLARSLILFPYFISTVVAVLVWKWLFNDLYGIMNHFLITLGIIDFPMDYLGTMPNAMISVILGRRVEIFPVRGDRGAGPPADDSGCAL
jgi:multiple sugar transport system permease protein